MKICAKNGSILVGMLWCLALLSVVVIGSLYGARIDLSITKHHGDRIQAYYLALAGAERAKAMLYEDARDRRQRGVHHSGSLYEATTEFKDVIFSRGSFRVGHGAGQMQDAAWTYGIRDEEGRLNINTVSKEELAKLPGSSESLAAAIVDFRDEDDEVTPGGAESETYASLPSPYLPRNQSFESVDELRMVYGMTPNLFLGEDANRNMTLDPEENDGKFSEPADNQDGRLDLGWSEWVTVNSSMSNTSASGEKRVSIQEASESDLSNIEGVTPDLAKAIVQYRKENEFQTIANLLDVVDLPDDEDDNNPTPNTSPANRANTTSPGNNRPGNTRGNSRPRRSGGSGSKLISTSEFITMSDLVTVKSDDRSSGRLNINTASEEVIACLPGRFFHISSGTEGC